MGPLSSAFDLLCFAALWWALGANTPALSPLFQSGWFVFGTVSQVLIIHVIRTAKVPFLQSRPSAALLVSTLLAALVSLLVGFCDLAVGLDMQPLPLSFAPWLALILTGYFLAAQGIKKFYIKRHGLWL